jgi:taurine--2-oxoglutarate transaminase
MATIETNPQLGAQVVADAKEYVLHSWSVQDALNPIAVAGAEGRHFWDYDGKRYLDFASQLVNVSIGHQHPKLVAAIKEQADKLCTIGPPMATEPRSTLARLISEVTPGDISMAFFTNGGAEANENAIKLARWYTGRHKVVARYRSYHGATAGAITLTGDPRRWPAEPGISGVVRMFDPYTYRCPAGHPDPCPVCTGAPHLEEILQYEGPQTVAAVILETVTGTNGIIVPPDGYLQSIREVCDRHGILLIADEVMAGFGRTGKWFAVDHWDVVPDIITMAKGINSGYVPLGAMAIREPIAEWIRSRPFAGGLTYSGHPLACAVGVASIEAFREEGIVEHAAEMNDIFRDALNGLADKHPSIGEVRGLGCFWGLELVRNRATREPLVPFNASADDMQPVGRIAKAALERGLYLMTHWNVIMVCPPLTITRDELDEGIAILDDILSIADEYCTGCADRLRRGAGSLHGAGARAIRAFDRPVRPDRRGRTHVERRRAYPAARRRDRRRDRRGRGVHARGRQRARRLVGLRAFDTGRSRRAIARGGLHDRRVGLPQRSDATDARAARGRRRRSAVDRDVRGVRGVAAAAAPRLPRRARRRLRGGVEAAARPGLRGMDRRADGIGRTGRLHACGRLPLERGDRRMGARARRVSRRRPGPLGRGCPPRHARARRRRRRDVETDPRAPRVRTGAPVPSDRLPTL